MTAESVRSREPVFTFGKLASIEYLFLCLHVSLLMLSKTKTHIILKIEKNISTLKGKEIRKKIIYLTEHSYHTVLLLLTGLIWQYCTTCLFISPNKAE